MSLCVCVRFSISSQLARVTTPPPLDTIKSDYIIMDMFIISNYNYFFSIYE